MPGAVAIGPFFIVANYYIPQIFQFWGEHPNAFVAIVGIAVLTAGLVCDNLGAALEYYVIDRVLKNADEDHFTNWYAYLKLKIGDEYVAQRYLRSSLVRMKFELGMVPALTAFGTGVLWIHSKYPFWSRTGVVLFTSFIVVAVIYFSIEAFMSAKNLATARKLILEAESAV